MPQASTIQYTQSIRRTQVEGQGVEGVSSQNRKSAESQ